MKRLFILFFAIVLLAPLNVLAQTYSLDPSHTTIQFKVKFMGFTNVKGSFDKFKGIVNIDDADITKSKADVSIETTSINTGINQRDKDLRGPDFFDVVKFPIMSFVATGVEAGTDKFKVSGNLTIKGVTKPVILNVEDPKRLLGDQKRGVLATTSINRQDFGVSSGSVISDEVFITINAELIKE
jgi:polyisoprenoid-binding protein YceI